MHPHTCTSSARASVHVEPVTLHPPDDRVRSRGGIAADTHLPHGVAGPQARAVRRHHLPGGRVLVAEHARLADARQKEVPRQELQPPRVPVLLC